MDIPLPQGAFEPRGHFCKWQRHPKEEDSTPEPPSIRPPPGLTPIEEPLLSSVGSLGHPYGLLASTFEALPSPLRLWAGVQVRGQGERCGKNGFES